MPLELRTPLCQMFGIDWPIFSVGFGNAAGAELAAAVSNAGGFGVLGGSGLPPSHIRAEVERTRTLTERPFGINIIIADDPAQTSKRIVRSSVRRSRPRRPAVRMRSSSSGVTRRPSSKAHTRRA
jgi:NAD(P)H-dependent flavin oxidoreductase YrpB (nitropropane dioxygenase family)